MPDELEQILRQVADGALTPEQAEPLIAALQQPRPPLIPPNQPPPRSEGATERSRRIVRLEVTEGGRRVVNLQVPMSWAALAGGVLPGLSDENADRLREAIRSGAVGRILEIQDDDGDGVVISTE